MRSSKIIAQLSKNGDISQKDNVTVTNVANVCNLIKKGDVLIKFYSSHCHHCIEMGSEWTNLINTPQGSAEPRHTIISIESGFLRNQEIHALLSKLNIHVSGFPTIIFVCRDKSIVNYEGPRTAHDMNNFINKNITTSMKRTGGISKKQFRKRYNKHRTKRYNKNKRGGCACGM